MDPGIMVNDEFYVSEMAISPDGKYVAVGGVTDAGKRNVWDLQKQTIVASLRGPGEAPGTAESLAFSPDGKYLAVGIRTTKELPGVELWDTTGWKYVNRLENPSLSQPDRKPGSVISVAFSPDRKYLAAGTQLGVSQGGIDLWDVKTGRFLKTLVPEAPWMRRVLALGFSPTSQYIAGSESPPHLHVWDVTSGEVVKVLKSESDPILPTVKHSYGQAKTVSFHPDGKRVAVAYDEYTDGRPDGYVTIWNVESGILERKIHAVFSESIAQLALSPDGRLVAVAGRSRGVRVFDFETGALVAEFTDHMDAVFGVAFTPDGQAVVGGGSRYIKVWELGKK
jgi:WD40 repeat protein